MRFSLTNKLTNFHKRLSSYFIELRKIRWLARLLAFLNAHAFVVFVFWYMATSAAALWTLYLVISVIILFFVVYIFVVASALYEGSVWVLWAWLSLIFVSPLGIVLFIYTCIPSHWRINPERVSNKVPPGSVGKMFDSTMNSLEKRWRKSLDHLLSMDKRIVENFLKNVLCQTELDFNKWTIAQINLIISMSLISKQLKQKDFKNFLWQPHWYDDQHFDFGIKNTKPITSRNKYPISIGVVILDEINNYRKILEKKIEIKQNLKFSPAKMISVHWCKDYRVYVNE